MRNRRGGSGRSSQLPSLEGDDRKPGRSKPVLTICVVVLVLIGIGAFVLRNEISAALNPPSPEQNSQPVAESDEDSVNARTDTRAEDRSRRDQAAQEPVDEQPTAGEAAPAPTEPAAVSQDKLFTIEELKTHDGSDSSKPIYLGLVGEVFDVSKAPQYYGQDGGYSFFSGRDGTRAFVTGDFTEEGLIDDVTGLSSANILGIVEWQVMYRKDYTYVGKLIGTYYDAHGRPTENLKNYNNLVEIANGDKLSEEEERRMFPPCNSHWAQGKGGTVWCSKERYSKKIVR